MRLILAILALLLAPAAAFAQCSPPQAPVGSVGCQPALGVPQSSDLLLGWRPSAFPGSLGTISVGNLGFLPLTGGALTGPLSAPTLTATGGAMTLGGASTDGTIHLGPSDTVTSAGGNGWSFSPQIVAPTFETTGALGILMNAPSNNSIQAVGTQSVGIGNLTNGILLSVVNDGSSSPATCFNYAEGTALGYSKLSAEGGVVPCQMRIDCSNPTIGAPCDINFNIGTDGEAFDINGVTGATDYLQVLSGAATGPVINAVGSETSVNLTLQAKGSGAVVIGAGNLVFGSGALPTSCTGKPTGTVWSNSGALEVCP